MSDTAFDYPLLRAIVPLSTLRRLNTESLRLSTREYFEQQFRDPTLKEILAFMDKYPEGNYGMSFNYHMILPGGRVGYRMWTFTNKCSDKVSYIMDTHTTEGVTYSGNYNIEKRSHPVHSAVIAPALVPAIERFGIKVDHSEGLDAGVNITLANEVTFDYHLVHAAMAGQPACIIAIDRGEKKFVLDTLKKRMAEMVRRVPTHGGRRHHYAMLYTTFLVHNIPDSGEKSAMIMVTEKTGLRKQDVTEVKKWTDILIRIIDDQMKEILDQCAK